jgi:hypothetical protein
MQTAWASEIPLGQAARIVMWIIVFTVVYVL